MSLRQATALTERHLPWFRKARSKFFVCQHCECRRHDAELLNKSPLPIHLIINASTERKWLLENEYSRAQKDAHKAATLPTEMWLPKRDEFELMIELSGVTSDEANKLRAAYKRLGDAQPHYNNIQTFMSVMIQNRWIMLHVVAHREILHSGYQGSAGELRKENTRCGMLGQRPHGIVCLTFLCTVHGKYRSVQHTILDNKLEARPEAS